MARPAKPLNVLFLNGTAKKNPARVKARANEPKNTDPLGPPLAFLDSDEKKAWRLITGACIKGVLGKADSVAVAMAAQLLNAVIQKEATFQEKNLLKAYLGQFGMTPSERSKINVPQDKPKNKFD